MAVCDIEKKNIGVGRCVDLPKVFRSFITVPKNWKVSFEDALLQATWQDAILAAKQNRIYPWPFMSDIPQYAGGETIYLRNAVGVSPVLDGKYEWLCRFAKNTCFHKSAYSHRATEGRVIFVDADGAFFGTTVYDGGTPYFTGYTMEMLHTENLLINDATRPSETPVRIALADPNEINHNDYGIVRVRPSWSYGSLNVLTDVELEIIGNPSATTIVVSVKQVCDGTEVVGLDDADFVLLDGSGDPQVISGAVDNGDGTYTLSGSGLETGSLNLVAAADLSVPGYESTGPVTVTIGS